MPAKMICPECEEPVRVARGGDESVRTARLYGHPTPRHSHLDGEPLCPIVSGKVGKGYEPAKAVRAT